MILGIGVIVVVSHARGGGVVTGGGIRGHGLHAVQHRHTRDSVKLFIGVFTHWNAFGSRTLSRLSYERVHIPETDTVEIMYVLGKPESLEGKVLVDLEQDVYGDLVVLDINENMNYGKTFAYFTNLAQKSLPYDYFMKLDDDSFLNIPQLLAVLRHIPLPRVETYVGRAYEDADWMVGAGYVLSADLVRFIGDTPPPDPVGNEDQLMGKHLREHHRGLTHFTNLRERVIDHISVRRGWEKEFAPDTVLIHQLKSPELFGDAVNYYVVNGHLHQGQD